MGLAGKQSKKEGAGQTQAAELAGCAVPKGSFSKRVVCGFQCMELHVLTQLSLLLLPPLDYLIKHVEEDAVRRRQGDVATAWGFWLMGICEGPAFGGPVPRSWAQHALLWFQRSQLPPLSLFSRA